MTQSPELFNAALIITSLEDPFRIERQELPEHIHVLKPFSATEKQILHLATRLAPIVFKRNQFDITGLEVKTLGNGHSYQKLGGSALHYIHDEAINALNRVGISHNNKKFSEGDTKTWYTGNWSVPARPKRVEQLYLARSVNLSRSAPWLLIEPYKLHIPDSDSGARQGSSRTRTPVVNSVRKRAV